MPAQQNSRRRHPALLGNLDDGLRGEQGAAGAAQGTVGGDVNALGLAEVDNLLLGQGGVVLDLVDGRDNGGLGKEFLQVLDAVVGDADGADLAGAEELLHALPGGDVAVVVDDVPRAIGQLGEDGVVSCKSLSIFFLFAFSFFLFWFEVTCGFNGLWKDGKMLDIPLGFIAKGQCIRYRST